MVPTVLMLWCLSQSSPPAQQRVQMPELAAELAARCKKDQDARFALIDFMARHKLAGGVVLEKLDKSVRDQFAKLSEQVGEADAANIAWMKDVVARHGWPGKSSVGKQGAANAWLLVQHADTDRGFQELCLEKMRAMAAGEVEGKHIAYLTDRVLLGRGKKQLYGTQGRWENGKTVAAPIEDEANVDGRRQAMGLGPLAEYLEQLNKVYTQPQPKKEDEKTRRPR
jgi:uncharacterized protein (DUF305 family)